jgi:hypothetical protein
VNYIKYLLIRYLPGIFDLAVNRDKWRANVNTVMNLRVSENPGNPLAS